MSQHSRTGQSPSCAVSVAGIQKNAIFDPRVARRNNALNNKFLTKGERIATESQFIYGSILAWVSELHDCPEFPAKWQHLNEYLMRIQSRYLKEEQVSRIVTQVAPEFIVFAISSILWKSFCIPILVGANYDKRIELERLLRAVSGLVPKRSFESISRWRSDTLQALSTFDEYEAQLEIEWTKATKLVVAMLKIAGFGANDTTPERINRFEQTIAEPFARLVSEIQCAPETYKWSWECPDLSLEKQHLGALEILDPRSQFTVLRPWLCHSEPPDQHSIGDPYFELLPALWKVNVTEDNEGTSIRTDTIVSKGWALAKLHGEYPGYGDGEAIELTERSTGQEYGAEMKTIGAYLKEREDMNSAEDNDNQTAMFPADIEFDDPCDGYLAYFEAPDGEGFPMFLPE